MIAIGVAGYRFLSDLDRIAAGVDEALRKIEQPLAVISPLAEGADRLVVPLPLRNPTMG